MGPAARYCQCSGQTDHDATRQAFRGHAMPGSVVGNLQYGNWKKARKSSSNQCLNIVMNFFRFYSIAPYNVALIIIVT